MARGVDALGEQRQELRVHVREVTLDRAQVHRGLGDDASEIALRRP